MIKLKIVAIIVLCTIMTSCAVKVTEHWGKDSLECALCHPRKERSLEDEKN